MIKLIASDMDGTLLNNRQAISKENVEAIKKAQNKGIKFLIATGRNYDEVQFLLSENDIICNCILMNGSEYRDNNGKIINRINIDKNLVSLVITNLEESKICIRLMTDNGIYTTNTKEEVFEAFVSMVKNYKDISEEKAIEIVRNHNYYTQIKSIDNINEFLDGDIEIRKILANFSGKEATDAMKNKIAKIGGLAVSASFSDNIEITDINAQKGIMLNNVVNELGINNDEVMVIGDSFNDYSMFTTFNESVAMGNAIDEIKKIAKYVTDTNENNGVCIAIDRVLSQL